MAEFDPGPTSAFATHWDNRPSYNSVKARFRMNWGPICYRGRLDGSAKVIIIGQDPAADENVARRILVGSAGQRVQGFLRKLGINKSYVMVNTFLVWPQGADRCGGQDHLCLGEHQELAEPAPRPAQDRPAPSRDRIRDRCPPGRRSMAGRGRVVCGEASSPIIPRRRGPA